MDNTRLKQLQSLLEEDPGSSFIQFAIAKEYEKYEQWPEARMAYETLTQDAPDYVGTYYHLGKTLEQLEGKTAAVPVYEQGMQVARQQADMHAFGELQRALLSAQGLDYEDEV